MLNRLAQRVKRMLCYGSNLSVVIPCAASLAQHGLLGSVKKGMTLLDVDLTSVPYEHLAFLASSVGQNGHVHIQNVSGCGLVTILDSLKSRSLVIYRQSLGSEETQALVRAMESGCNDVNIFGNL